MRTRQPLMPDTAPLLTAEQLERFPRDDRRYELVRGRIVPMTPVYFEHGRVVTNVLLRLTLHLRERRLGVAVTEAGFILATNPDTVRAPDIAFVRQDRVPSRDQRGFFKGPPDAAMEVLSPDDRPAEIRDKIAGYLGSGVPLVVIIDPAKRTATSYRTDGTVTAAAGDEPLDVTDVIADFRCTLREFFM